MTLRKTSTELAAVAALAFGLAACQQPKHLAPDFGDAVRQNMAVHIINPQPMPLDKEGPALAGSRAEGALERYQSGNVIEPEPLATATIGGGDSGN